MSNVQAGGCTAFIRTRLRVSPSKVRQTHSVVFVAEMGLAIFTGASREVGMTNGIWIPKQIQWRSVSKYLRPRRCLIHEQQKVNFHQLVQNTRKPVEGQWLPKCEWKLRGQTNDKQHNRGHDTEGHRPNCNLEQAMRISFTPSKNNLT